MEMWKKGKAYFLLFATFFMWGSVYVAGKMVSDLPAPVVAACRCGIACFPLLLMSRKYLSTRIEKSDWKYFAIVGVFGYYLTIFLIQLGISLTGASMAALINATTPIGITVFAVFILKEKITPVKIICLILAIAGTVIISLGTETRGEIMGMAAVLTAVITFSIASCFMRKLTAKYPPVLVTTYGMLISMIFHIPTGIISAVKAGGVHFEGRHFLVLLYLGVIGSGLAQYTWTSVLQILPASTCSLFYPLQPMFAAILGALLLNEKFTPSFFIGLILISFDVILSTLETRKLQQQAVEERSHNGTD